MLRRLSLRLSIEHLWVLTVLIGIFAFLNTHPIRPQDFWWHMAVGRDIVTSGHIPAVDTYSYTRLGEPYPSYNVFWLMEVVIYEIYQAGGPILILILESLVVTAAYALLVWGSYRLCHNWRAAAFGALFAAALGFGNWNVRPQSITYLYGALILLAIYESRLTLKKGWLVVFPIVMTIWVNSHGSYPIGLAFIGCWLAEECWSVLVGLVRRQGWQLKGLILPGSAMILGALACLINPKGLWTLTYLQTMAGNTVVQNYILEWMPPNFNSLEGILFYAGLMGSAVLLAVSPRRPKVFQIMLFLIFGVLGLKYVRGIIWFGIAMAGVVADHLAAIFEKNNLLTDTTQAPKPSARRLNLIFLGLLVVLAFFSLPWFKSLFPFTHQKSGLISVETPIDATQYILDQKLPGNLFHDMAFGSYLMWAAQPEYKVFVDSRVELYPIEIWNDYLAISEGQCNWQELLDHYGVKTLMLEPVKQIGLINAAKASPNWSLVYQDEQAVIFTRSQK